MFRQLKDWAGALRRDIHAIFLVGKDPRVPWYAKALAISVAAYALSPIDLIPDFVPVLGYLDDLLIVPLGIWLVIKLIPVEVMAEYREIAAARGHLPVSKSGAIAIITIWILSLAAAGWAAMNWMASSN